MYIDNHSFVMESSSHIVEDCGGGIVQLFSDGKMFRLENIEFPMQAVHDESVRHKDCLFDQTHGLHLRLYKPIAADPSPPVKKLPVLFYFHGGGFVVGSRDWPNCHNTGQRLASGLQAVVVAPEHRLPAAIDDGVAAVKWLKSRAVDGGEEWLTGVDFDRVYVLGDSSGGNIAHHLAVRLGVGSPGLGPVRVRGYILLAPFFGGVDRTQSEEGPSEQLLSLEVLDRSWSLCLPVGENRDHPFANPFGPAGCPDLEKIPMDPILVIVGGCELLRDRAHDYVKRLKKMNKEIEYVEIEGQEHGFFTNQPYAESSNDFIELLRGFMSV